MPLMKIENLYGLSDTFTWPYNPNVFDDTFDSNHETQPIRFQRHHILVSGGGIAPKPLILTGHMTGTSKRTNYRSMVQHFQDTIRLKKLYWESDKFYLGIGRQCKQTNSGGRTNFIDYVATFETIIGILFGDTLRTSGTNAGDVTTFVEEFAGRATNGAVDITISDSLGNTITIPSSEFASDQYFIYLLIWLVDTGGGIYVSEYGQAFIGIDSGTTTSTTAFKLVDSGQNFLTTVTVGDIVINNADNAKTMVTAVDSDTELSLLDDIMVSGKAYGVWHQTKKVSSTSGYGLLKIAAGANVSTITYTNVTATPTIRFRDGWCD